MTVGAVQWSDGAVRDCVNGRSRYAMIVVEPKGFKGQFRVRTPNGRVHMRTPKRSKRVVRVAAGEWSSWSGCTLFPRQNETAESESHLSTSIIISMLCLFYISTELF